MPSVPRATDDLLDHALRIADLRLELDGVRILDDVSLTVSDGEYVAIVGPNGAGKTSLLRCLLRIHRNWWGRIEILGADLAGFSQRELGRLVSYVPQLTGPLPPFTVRELVEMARYPYQTPLRPIDPGEKEIVRDALAVTGCGPLADRRLDTLSGGERQKALLAAALAQGGRILLLDEPTSFLDPHYDRDLRQLLQRLNREQGATIVEVTHDLNAAILGSDRIIALRDGRLVFQGTADEFADPAVLEEVFGCPFLVGEHPRTGGPIILPEVIRP